MQQAESVGRSAPQPQTRTRTVSHREGGRSSSVLGLDDLISSKLDALDEGGVGLSSSLNNLLSLSSLGQQWDDGDTRVSSNHGNDSLRGLSSGNGGEESRGANNVKSGDSKESTTRL